MKYNIMALSVLGGLIATPIVAHAVDGGTSLNWSEESTKVEMSCTGEVLAGKWVITAAHCNNASPQPVSFSPLYSDNNTSINTTEQLVHSNYAGGVDISLWKQSGRIDYGEISELNPNKPAYDINVFLKGFGGGNRELGSVKLLTFDYSSSPNDPIRLYMKPVVGEGNPVPGDSGGPIYDATGKIVSIFSTNHGLGIYSSTYINTAKDFILQTINDWHYPTRLKTVDGINTVTVQSLHQNPTADSAYTQGDLTIVSGSCVGNNTIQPYDTCTYDVTSSGGEGKLVLDSTTEAYVLVNKTIPEPPTPEPEPNPTPNPTPTPNTGGSGGGGGSLGFFSLLALGLLARKR